MPVNAATFCTRSGKRVCASVVGAHILIRSNYDTGRFNKELKNLKSIIAQEFEAEERVEPIESLLLVSTQMVPPHKRSKVPAA